MIVQRTVRQAIIMIARNTDVGQTEVEHTFKLVALLMLVSYWCPTTEERGVDMRILLIEDDFLVAWGVQETLSAAGHDVRRASNGREGLTALTDFSPDVIVTDRLMPVLNGLEFAKIVRAAGLAPHAPLVLLSGHAGDLSPSEKEPFAMILAKPIADEELLAKVEAAVAAPC